jgi:hypothetical protein
MENPHASRNSEIGVQSLQHHHQPSRDHRPLRDDQPLRRNLPPMPGVLPDYPAPVVRNTDAGTEMMAMRRDMLP